MRKYLILLLLLSSCSSNNNEENNNENKKDSVTFSPVPKIESREITDTTFSIFWKEFTQLIKTKNKNVFKTITTDSLDCGVADLTTLDKFMASSYAKLFDTALVNKFDREDKIQFYNISLDADYAPRFLLQQLKTGKTTTKEVSIEVSDEGDEPIVVNLKFADTKNGYKFYGYDK